MTETAPAVVGLIVRRSPRQFATSPFYAELIGGMEQVLHARGMHVLMRVVDGIPAELDCYRRWAADKSVAAVVLVDIVPDDPRPALVRELGLPAVIAGEPDPAAGLPAVRTDNYGAMRALVAGLTARGHRQIALVTGPSALLHTRERIRGFLDAAAELAAEPMVEEGDYSPEAGAAATRWLLTDRHPPTAVIYDNDLMAIAGLQTAREMRLSVPRRVSIVAWDDSAACLSCQPPVSAMSHDVHERGILTARALLAVLDGTDQPDLCTPPSVFVSRGSTAAERSAGPASLAAGGARHA